MYQMCVGVFVMVRSPLPTRGGVIFCLHSMASVMIGTYSHTLCTIDTEPLAHQVRFWVILGVAPFTKAFLRFTLARRAAVVSGTLEMSAALLVLTLSLAGKDGLRVGEVIALDADQARLALAVAVVGVSLATSPLAEELLGPLNPPHVQAHSFIPVPLD